MRKHWMCAGLIGLACGWAQARGHAPDIKDVPNTQIQQPIAGVVKDMDERKMIVADDFGHEVSINFNDRLQVLRDGKEISVAQVREGDRVMVNASQQ